MQPVEIERIVDAKWRLNDGQLYHQFSAGGGPHPEIGPRGNGELALQAGLRRRIGKLIQQVLESGRIQLQRVLANNPDGAHVHKKARGDRPGDGNAIFKISPGLHIATRERDGVTKDGHTEGTLNGSPVAVQRRRIGVDELLRGSRGNKRYRRNGADIKTANVVFSAHIEAAERRNFLATVPGDICRGDMNTQNVPLLINGMEHRVIENIADAVDVAAQRAAGKRKGVEILFASRGILRIIDGVVGNAGRDAAGYNAVERAGAGNAAKLELLEEQRGSLIESGDVRAREAVGRLHAGERALL